MLSAHNVTKAFGGTRIIEDVSLAVRRGEAVGLLGPSGAGKTTVFGTLIGITVPDAGQVVLDEVDITRMALFERARRGMSYLPQEPSVFRGLTVEQNILLMLETHSPPGPQRRQMLDWLLAEFGIERLRRTKAGKLSGGERRRCEIARALACNPSFVLLDEPFAGIDPIAVDDIRALVRFLTQQEVGVLVTDHNVRETLGLVDRAYILESGRILMHGTVEAVVADPLVQRVYLGADFRL